MESQGGLRQQTQQGEGGGSKRRRERKRGGGSGGLVVGIAAVVVVGVAGKLLQRFSSLKKGSNAVGAGAKDSVDKTVASEGNETSAGVLKKVLSIIGDHESTDDHGGSQAPSVDVKEKFIGCGIPAAVEEKGRSRSRSFGADAEITDQDSLRDEYSDSRNCAEIHVNRSLDKGIVVPSADHHEDEAESLRRHKLETNLAELLHHQCLKREAAVDDDNCTLSKTKDLQDDIAEVISRAFADVGRRGELSSQHEHAAALKKLTVQVLWDDKPEPEEFEADDAEISASIPRSKTTVRRNADSEVNSESESESGNVVGEFMDARDTDLWPAAVADEIEGEFVNAETQIEDTRMYHEVSGSEYTDWPQAITFSEFINSVQASTSAEMKEDVSELADSDSVAERDSLALPQSEGDLAQTDRNHVVCGDPSSISAAVHEEAENDAQKSLSESDIDFYDGSHEEGQTVLVNCEACPYPFSESPEEREHTSRENRTEEEESMERQRDERAESKSQGSSKEIMEPEVEEENFEEPLSSLEPETAAMTMTPSAANDDGNGAKSEVERAIEGIEVVEGEDSGTATGTSYRSEDKLVVQTTDDPSGFSANQNLHVEIGEVTFQNAEKGPGRGEKEEEDANTKAKSSVLLPSKPSNPTNSVTQNSRNRVTDSSCCSANNSAENAVMTTAEASDFTSRPSIKGGNLKLLETSRDRSAMEVLRMAILIALIAAIVFVIREHHLKPLRHRDS